MHTVRVGPCRIAYQDVGQGTPVILAHCSSASHKMWKRLVQALQSGHRVIAPDLVGYGDSDSWPADIPFDIRADVDVICRLAESVEESFHLAAHSYGAAVALEAARSLGDQVRSLALVEPVAFHLLRLAERDSEWAEVNGVSERIQRNALQGNDRKAADAYMGFWIGRLRWWVLPRAQRKHVIDTMQKVAAEFGIIHRVPTTLEEYGRINAPTRLIVGGRTKRPARAVVNVLEATLPNVETREIPGAGHMSPFTHESTVRRLVLERINRQEPGR